MALPTVTVTPGSGQTINTLQNSGSNTSANSHPVVIASDQAQVPVVGQIMDVSVTPTITASSYTSGFVWGGIITIANILNATTFDGELISLTLKFKASIQTLQFDVAIFKASPSNGTYADHAAPTWNGADMANLLGIYPLAVANSDFGTMTIYNLDNIGKAISGASGSLFAVIIGKAASTNTPGSTSDMTLEAATIL